MKNFYSGKRLKLNRKPTSFENRIKNMAVGDTIILKHREAKNRAMRVATSRKINVICRERNGSFEITRMESWRS